MSEFLAWPKIPRLTNETTIITEKIDGTNGCIAIHNDGSFHVQSRSRIITPENDNYGFAKFVYKNIDTIKETLKEGYHFGEWFGNGIQRGYGLTEKKFALFNQHRWQHMELPEGLCTVPLLPTDNVQEALTLLQTKGSFISPGFMKVEGIVVYNVLAKTRYKVIIDK